MLKAFLYIVSLCCIVSACSIFEEPEEFTFVNIDTNFIIDLSQTLEPGNNALLFNIQSTQKDNCIDSHIEVESSIVQNQLQLILGDIISQEPCQRIPNQLESSAQFMLGPRDYRINISLKDVIQNFGTVSVSDENFILELETENGIIIGRQKIEFIPDNYVWGTMEMSNSEDFRNLNTFLIHLKSITKPSELTDGDYGFFEIKDESFILYDQTEIAPFEQQFIFKQTSDFDFLQINLNQFATQFPDAKIEVLNSTGESFVQ